MTKTAYLIKITEKCPLDGVERVITKWVNSGDIPVCDNVAIFDKRILTEGWVWFNEIFTMDPVTKEPYAVTQDYCVR